MKISIRSKLVFLIEIAVITVSLAAGITSYFVLQKVFEQRVYEQLRSVTVLKQGQINHFINMVNSQVEYVASEAVMGEKVSLYLRETNKTNKEAVIDHLNELMLFSNNFSELFVLNMNGEIILATNEEDEGKIKSNELYFTNAKEATYIQDLSYDISVGTASIMVGTPIKDDKGVKIGVMVGRVETGEINKIILERAGLGSTGESVLVNANNLVINDLLKDPDSALKKTIFNQQVTDCLGGATFSRRAVDYAGDSVFGYYQWFPEIKSCISTEIDTSEALLALQRIYLIILGIVLGVAAVVGLVGYIIGNKLFFPLHELQEEVKKINEGNFDVKVDIRSNDEIGEVARSFNEMASKLKVSYTNLEGKVAEKTKSLEDKLEELEKMNDLMVGRELTMIELKEKLKEKETK